MRHLAGLVVVAVGLMLGAAGCVGPSRVAWSPDGTHAIYTAANGSGQVVLVDRDGQVQTHMDAATGEVGWSADSSTAYFGSDDRGGPRPAAISHKWIGDADEPPGSSTTDAAAVCRWRDGKVDRLVAINRAIITAVRPSPDGRWLVIAAEPNGSLLQALLYTVGKKQPDGGGPGLYAYALPSGRLYRLTDVAVPNSFTGPNRLATVESTGPNVGEIVEQSLDESAAKPERTSRVAVLPDVTPAPQPADGGMLFVTVGGTFPSPPPAPTSKAIYRVLPDGRIDRLADVDSAAGLTFSVSPNGHRVLFCQSARRGEKERSTELTVMDADGSHRRGLMDLAAIPGSWSITPAWHGNDRITCAAPTQGQPVPTHNAENQRTAYDVVDYDVPPDGPMRPAKTLSQNWPPELKPSTPGVREIAGPAVQSPR